jgi:nitrate reductase beta subunit
MTLAVLKGTYARPLIYTGSWTRPAHAEDAGALMGQHEQLFCSLDTDGGPGMGGAGPHGIQSYQPGSPAGDHSFRAGDGQTHFNLLGWNGQDSAPGLFPGRDSS